MDFLNPIGAIIAAAVAGPLLVLMYFLKLKRREVYVPSTLLWQRAIQDLQVNAPFQKLRKNILLLLQLLVLGALLFALARPVLSLTRGPGQRYVILIDRSASMQTREASGDTRLALAKRQADTFVDSLREHVSLTLEDSSDQAMVIAFDGRAKVMCNFTSDKSRIRAAIDAIEPADGQTAVAEALTVARAFAQTVGEEADNGSAAERAEVVLFSDGRIGDLPDVAVAPGEVNYHRIGDSEANVGVVAMEVRRKPERPDELEVFAALANYGEARVETDVELSIDGATRGVRKVVIPPAERFADQPPRPGQAGVSFSLTHDGAGVVRVRHLHADALTTDNAAWATLRPPRRLNLLLITRGNLALEQALAAIPLGSTKTVTPEQFQAMDADVMAVQQPYDAIVLDGWSPEKLPRGRYLVFGPPPRQLGLSTQKRDKVTMFVDWKSRHPVLENVNLENIYVADRFAADLPRDAEVLAEFSQAPAIAVLRREGSTFLMTTFDVLQSTWPFDQSFVIFCFNAVAYLGNEAAALHRGSYQVGESLRFRGQVGAGEATLKLPDGRTESIPADPSGVYRVAGTRQVGVYELELPDGRTERFAVNLLSPAESDVAPRDELIFAGVQSAQAQGEVARANQELWPILALVGLLLVCVEWVVYNAKVRL